MTKHQRPREGGRKQVNRMGQALEDNEGSRKGFVDC